MDICMYVGISVCIFIVHINVDVSRYNNVGIHKGGKIKRDRVCIYLFLRTMM